MIRKKIGNKGSGIWDLGSEILVPVCVLSPIRFALVVGLQRSPTGNPDLYGRKSGRRKDSTLLCDWKAGSRHGSPCASSPERTTGERVFSPKKLFTTVD